MDQENLDKQIQEKISRLQEKFQAMGQDLPAYLEGLLHSDYLRYWDYINLDTLLTLQQPKTKIPDEPVFIMYHQITELYFKMVLWELRQMTEKPMESWEFAEKLSRVNRYFEILIDSFEVMTQGMQKEQFLKFRMALLPSSGFQSVQFRLIELYATDLDNLLSLEVRENGKLFKDRSQKYENIYWKKGATELASRKKTLTLSHFEEKYDNKLLRTAHRLAGRNIRKVYPQYIKDPNEKSRIADLLRKFDELVNIQWCLAHYKSAVRHLQKDPVDIAATGGTNWQKFLPPKFQKVIFYPELWTSEELENWGKSWVVKEVLS